MARALGRVPRCARSSGTTSGGVIHGKLHLAIEWSESCPQISIDLPACPTHNADPKVGGVRSNLGAVSVVDGEGDVVRISEEGFVFVGTCESKVPSAMTLVPSALSSQLVPMIPGTLFRLTRISSSFEVVPVPLLLVVVEAALD